MEGVFFLAQHFASLSVLSVVINKVEEIEKSCKAVVTSLFLTPRQGELMRTDSHVFVADVAGAPEQLKRSREESAEYFWRASGQQKYMPMRHVLLWRGRLVVGDLREPVGVVHFP